RVDSRCTDAWAGSLRAGDVLICIASGGLRRFAKSSRQDPLMSNRETWIARCAAAALDSLGRDCGLCGATNAAGLVCDAWTDAPPALREHCRRGALPAPRGALCGSCLSDPPHFDSTVVLWPYEFPADRLVQALKYRAWLGMASFFARQLAARD